VSVLQAYSTYNDSGVEWIGQIPAHWQACRTKFVAKLYSGHTPSRDKPEYWVPEECTIPWFTLADVWQLRDGTRTYLGDTSEKISPIGLANSAARLLPADTVIVSRTASVGFAGIMPRPMATTQDFVNWVCRDRIRPRFLLHVFRAMRGEFSRLTMGSTHQTIYMPDVKSFSTPLPPLDEQEEIIAFLDRETARIDGLIAKERRLIELLWEKRQASISHAVTRGLDPTAPMKDSGIEWLGEIPAHWEVKRLKYVAEVIDCKHVTPAYTDDGVPIISTTEVKPFVLSLNSIRLVAEKDFESMTEGERRPKVGDIIYSRNASLGAAARVSNNDRFCMGQDICLIRPKEIDSEFLEFQLNSYSVVVQLDQIVVGATFRRINVESIRNYWTVVPPRDEQHRIATRLVSDFSTCATAIQKVLEGIAELEERRAALIAAAVTGKIDVRAHLIDKVEAAD
jgi:type I restriction enzyme S subunit